MHLRGAVLLVFVLLAVLAPTAPPAWARPAQVGLVSFVGATTTSLTLSWPKASGARGYEIFRSTRRDLPYLTRVKTSTGPTATVKGMVPGKTYCFQVRARAGSSFGYKSARTCKPTIRSQAPVSGPSYSVMTFNVCSSCGGWSSREVAARTVVNARQPDVLASQEAGVWHTPPSGYTQAFSMSAKRLFYKTARFTLVSSSGRPRAGYIEMSDGRYAVWAELQDMSNGKRLIFVNAHNSSSHADYARRGREIDTLLTRMAQINNAGLEVVYAGDFNSNKSRGTYNESTGFGAEDTVARTFADAGYYDAYDLAMTLKRPNWSSAHGFYTTPRVSRTWGDHVDHVFIKPGKANVWRWMNAALYSGFSYKTPIPSDHSPVQVDLYIP